MNPLKDKDLILELIETLIYQGTEGNMVIIDLNEDYYIQCITNKGDYEIHCEAVSNNYLYEDTFLSDSQINQLLELGWNKPRNNEENYFIEYPIDSEKAREKLAEIITKTAQEIYNHPVIIEEDFNLQIS